jgi:hypothetical protein
LPSSLDFGNITTGQTKDLTVTISNSGGGALTLLSLTAPGAPFTLVSPPATPASVPAAGLPITIRFSPTVAGAQSARLSLTTNDPNNGASTVTLTGSGVAPVSSVQTVVIGVDGGNFATLAGSPFTGFVNRLTPSGYPATLRSVQIVFVSDPTTLQPGASINVLTGANAAGSPGLSGIKLSSTPAKVTTAGQFNTYSITPITIQSGDFVVGFSAAATANTFPAAVDISSGSKLRSYVSLDGVNFGLIDTFLPGGGNLGIRAVVDVPAK